MEAAKVVFICSYVQIVASLRIQVYKLKSVAHSEVATKTWIDKQTNDEKLKRAKKKLEICCNINALALWVRQSDLSELPVGAILIARALI